MNKQIIGAVALTLLATATIAPGASAMTLSSTATTTVTTVATTTATTTPVVATTTRATTTPVTNNTTIAGLLAQLAKLTTLFNELKAKLMGTQAEIKELRADIREGMTDADIKTIQELLASDATIYPQGLVTGYFGPMTKEAIKRFQAKNGLEVTGEIDAETRAAMDSIIEERRAQGKFPVGLLLAPGLKQKFENKLKIRCDKTALTTENGALCEKINTKYKFEMDEKGQMKMESKMEKKMDDDDMDNEDEESENDNDESNDDNDEDNDEDER